MNFAQPESTAESLTRIGGAVAAGIGALTLWGLYASDNPSNWLSNLGMSIGGNDFRTLSMFGAGALVIGGALFLRKGLYLIVVGMVVALALIGHGKWYTIGNKTSANVQMASMGGHRQPVQAKQSPFINTGVKMTQAQLDWCDLDDDQDGKKEAKDTDGKINRWDSSLAKKNCETGYIHKARK